MNTYNGKPIRSTSSTVCGNGLFNVSGKINAKIPAMSEIIPYKMTGKFVHIRAYHMNCR